MKTILVLLSLIFISTQTLFAGGPWTQIKNEGIIIGNISPVIYKSYSSANSDRVDMWRRVSEVSTQAYFEIGLSDRLLLTGNLVLKYVGSSTKIYESDYFADLMRGPLPSGKTFGMGNSSIGMKYRFTKKYKFQVAMSFQIEFPGSNENVANGLRTGYDAWTFIPAIHLGQGFSNGIYYFVEGGFAGHTSISDEYRIKGEFGYHFKKPLVMAVAINVKESLKNKTPAESSNFMQTGLYLNNQEFIAWEFKFVHEVTETVGWTAALAGGATTELIARTPVVSFGMFYKWKAKPFNSEE